MRPHFWRKDVNVAEADIVRNLRLHPPEQLASKESDDLTLLDAIAAGPDRRDVVNLFDGGDETYWEPAFPEDHTFGLWRAGTATGSRKLSDRRFETRAIRCRMITGTSMAKEAMSTLWFCRPLVTGCSCQPRSRCR